MSATNYVCSKCGLAGENTDGWLVANRNDGKGVAGEMVIRCPEHITEAAIRRAGGHIEAGKGIVGLWEYDLPQRPRKTQTNFRLSVHVQTQLREISEHQGRSATQVLETAIDHYYVEVIRDGMMQNAARAAKETKMERNWQDVFGDGMTAKQIVDSLGAEPAAIAAWLEAQYADLAADNPHGGYDRTVDAVTFARQIISEAAA